MSKLTTSKYQGLGQMGMTTGSEVDIHASCVSSTVNLYGFRMAIEMAQVMPGMHKSSPDTVRNRLQEFGLCTCLFFGLPLQQCQVSLVVRKPVFGVSDQVRHKPGCTIIEDG